MLHSMYESRQRLSGMPFAYLTVFQPALSKGGFEDRAAECISWYVEGLAAQWESKWGNDEPFKQALGRLWTTKKLVIVNTYKRGENDDYFLVTLVNGSVQLGCDDRHLINNT